MPLRQKTIKAVAPSLPPPMPPRQRTRKREVAGVATADCAVVCCCMPCAVMDLVVLAAYKVPAGLVKKAIGKKERRRRKKIATKALLLQKKQPVEVHVVMQVETQQKEQNGIVATKVGPMLLEEHLAKDAAEDPEAVEMEEEMWAQFNGTGFWRSPSQRLNEHQLLIKSEEGMHRV